MKNTVLETPDFRFENMLTRNKLKQLLDGSEIEISNGGVDKTCHYRCAYDDGTGGTSIYDYTGASCITTATCTNSAPCAAIANGRDWVVSQTCT